jgi:purine-binding chemotaxis protein CheW
MTRREQTKRALPEPEKYVQMISFTVGKERFGVEILVVQEIIMMSNITEIPNAPDFVEGVINLRGNIIPVLDLRKRLRMRSSKPDGTKPGTRILVVEIDDNITGFIVDSVAKVITVPASRISPPPDIIMAGVQSLYISGVLHLDEGILVVLDFRKILSIEEKDSLEGVTRLLPQASMEA